MRFFGISDLHLSFTKPADPSNWEQVELHKPMDIFNPEWHRHYQKIYENWWALVQPDDIVLLPGDISWATRLEEARHDVDFLGLLPGTIYAVPGSHDYWWQGISKTRAFVPGNVKLIQNDHAMVFDRQKLINGELAPFIRVSKEQAASGITDEELDALIQVMMEQEKHQELK